MRSIGLCLLLTFLPLRSLAQFYVTDHDGNAFVLHSNEFTDEWERVDAVPEHQAMRESFSPFGLVRLGENDHFEEYSPELDFFIKRMMFPVEIIRALRPGAGQYHHLVMERSGNIVVTCERGKSRFLCLVLHPWSTQIYLPENHSAFAFEDIRSVVPADDRRGVWMLDGEGRMILFDVGDGGRAPVSFSFPGRAEINPPARDIVVQMTPERSVPFRYLLRFDGEPFMGAIDFTEQRFEPMELPYGFVAGPDVRFHPRYTCADLVAD